MAERPISQRGRKWRILRDAVILLLALVFLAVTLDFPIFTAGQALRATQIRYYWEDGEMVARLPPGNIYKYQYLLRNGNWYAWCGLSREGLLWNYGSLVSVYRDPEQPLTAITPVSIQTILVVAGDPDIAQVEVEYPITVSLSESSRTCQLKRLRQNPVTEHCFWFQPPEESSPICQLEDIRLRGYAADGTLIYQSPIPESWAKIGIHVTE